jgi:hypothetical protein
MTEKADSSTAGSQLAKLGSSKGGKARAAKMTAEERAEAARAAVMARWKKEKGIAHSHAPVRATYGAPDRPLRIGPIEIPCYVLSDGRRVLATRGLQVGLGLSGGGAKSPGARRLAVFLAALKSKGIEVNDLIVRINTPISFVPPHGGKPAEGHEATILPDFCKAVVAADDRDLLLSQQKHVAHQCRILLQGLAHVGIIALVDEATGFQAARERDALAQILEAFVAKELRPWLKTFPAAFYQEIYRLKGWEYSSDSNARPAVIGRYTNDLIYERLAPGVLDELRRLTPRDEKGRLKNKLHQRLTEDVGHPKLREHLTAAIMLARYASSWDVFMERMDTEFPRWGDTMRLRFD